MASIWLLWTPWPLRPQNNGSYDIDRSKGYITAHYSDVMMGAMASQITSLGLLIQPFIQVQIKQNIKVLHHWPLCGEFTGDRWIPAQMASNAENVYTWWRHHIWLVRFASRKFSDAVFEWSFKEGECQNVKKKYRSFWWRLYCLHDFNLGKHYYPKANYSALTQGQVLFF